MSTISMLAVIRVIELVFAALADSRTPRTPAGAWAVYLSRADFAVFRTLTPSMVKRLAERDELLVATKLRGIQRYYTVAKVQELAPVPGAYRAKVQVLFAPR